MWFWPILLTWRQDVWCRAPHPAFLPMVIPNGDGPKSGCKQPPYSFYICTAFCCVAVPQTNLIRDLQIHVRFVPHLFLLQIRSQFPEVAQQSQKVNTSMTVINMAILLLLGRGPLAHPQQHLGQTVPYSLTGESLDFPHLIGMGHRFCLCPVYHNTAWLRENHVHRAAATT